MTATMRAPNVDWSFLPAAAKPGQHGAYVVRDSAGDVLYVGQTNHLQRRLAKGHRYTAVWYPRMASVEFIPCDGRTEARVLEKSLIAKYRPAMQRGDTLTPRVPKRLLPDEHVARLVTLWEAYNDAHLWHREAERAAYDAYVAALHAEGWTLASIGHALHMTRQAISRRHVQLAAEVEAAA